MVPGTSIADEEKTRKSFREKNTQGINPNAGIPIS